MKFINISALFLSLYLSHQQTADAFVPASLRARALVTPLHVASSTDEATAADKPKSKKAERLEFMKSGSFHRRGFKEVREGVEQTMEKEYNSALVAEMRSNDHIIERDGVTVYLAKVSVVLCCMPWFLTILHRCVAVCCVVYCSLNE